jgi:nicotinate-nucleotide adenylyltransferase
LALGNYFAENTDLDQVWFVVSPQNPFKVNDLLLEDQHRLKMVRLAVIDQPHLKVSDVEFSIPKPSYTIHTLEHLFKIHPEKQFVLLMGQDNLNHFNQWKQYEKILALLTIYVYPRNEKIVAKQKLQHKKIKLMDAPQLDYASTDIRKILQQGKSVEELMPHASWIYLKEKGFYK